MKKNYNSLVFAVLTAFLFLILATGVSAISQSIYAIHVNGNIARIAPNGTATQFSSVSAVGNELWWDITADVAGNLYTMSWDDYGGAGIIAKVTPDGTASQFSSVHAIDTQWVYSSIVADTSGNLYTVSNNKIVAKVTPDGTASYFSNLSAIGQPDTWNARVAIDPAGNIYSGNWNGIVAKVTPNGAATQFSNLAGILDLNGITADAAGNLYALGYSGTAARIAPNGTATKFSDFSAIVSSGWYGIAADAIGNLYVANRNGIVAKVTPDGAATPFSNLNNVNGGDGWFSITVTPILQNCADQGGFNCASPNICSQSFIPANDTSYCCPSEATCNAPACGDGIINQVSEQCDGTDFGEATCASLLGLGYVGNLACNSCSISTSGCYTSCEDTFQPSAGLNDGTDDGSESKGKDTRIYSHVAQEADTNYGSLDKLMFVYYSGYQGYPLLKFDVSTLPSNIDSAKLYLYVNPGLDTPCCSPGCTAMSWTVNRIASDWNEMTVTYNTRPTLSGSYGTLNIPTLTTYQSQWVSVDITTLYNGWKDGTIPNYGIGFTRLESTWNACTWFNLVASSDFSTASLRPKLVIQRHCVEPVCGNGILEGTEQCDEGAEDSGNNNCIFNQIGKKCDPVTCQIQDVISIVETCNNKDDDCEGAIDEGVTRICGDGWTGICTLGFETCSYGEWAGCTAQFPRAEDCNYWDDDCNGFVDEGLTSRSCGTDTGECISASQSCANGAWSQCDNTGPIPEICDNKDNNCDGTTDNFFGPDDCSIGQAARCTNGVWEICQSATDNVTVTDNCDGLDNDNDGQIDEDFASTTCSTSDIGECSEGVTVCNNASGVICTGKGPAPEICDGLDNDCDSQIDESLQRACTTSGMAGAQRCINADWGPCDPINHAPEICDNLDNDWNGLVDDNLIVSCYLGSNGTEGVGVCKSGLRSCTSGAWSGCLGQVLPSTEICDGKDDDCDGLIDEDLIRSTNELGECSINTETCSAGVWISNNEYAPVTDNNCDGLDQDCNGINDNDHAPTPTSCGIGECTTNGQLVCVAGSLQDTCTAGTPTAEVCDSKDNDCNSISDDKDTDADGFNDCTADKCAGLQLPNPPAAFEELKNNHYSLSTQLGYGCTCEEVLYCKPGKDEGEFKFGCSEGTKKVWEAQSQDSWAPECQQNGVVVAPGVSKSFFENTDEDILLDILDGDNDNDGLSDSVDDMVEDKDPLGDSDHGVPDWHPKSKYKK